MRRRAAVLLIAVLGCAGVQAAERPDEPELPFTPKPTAPIGIRYKLAAEPQVGEALTIHLTISAGEPMSDGELTLAAADPLALIDPIAPVPLEALDTGATQELDVTVLPLAVQEHYLDVSISADIRGERQTRAIVVPIRIASTQPKKATAAPAEKAGDSVHSFKAIETVR